MHFRGTVEFAAAQTAVWQALTTPQIVSQCTPRLQGWSMLDKETQFHLQFVWGSGRSTIHIPILLDWQTITPPSYLQWQAQAKMGNTILPLQGDFHLNRADTGQTCLNFTAHLEPPNKLLEQMLQTSAPKLINSFFSCLKKTAEAV